jgi:hypothetical protein
MSEQNGTAPETVAAAAEEPCADCATSGEKILAILAGVFGVLVLLMAVDMFTGGRVSGMVRKVEASVDAG